jgi:hypothetical protein
MEGNLKEKRKNLVLFYCVFSILLLLLIYPSHAAAQVEVKTQNGITVVHNPKTPVQVKGSPSLLTLKEDLVIGKETDKEDYWFAALNSIAVDNSGNIYTLDPKVIRIRVFDSRGKLLRVFGRRGQGPGEFSGPGLADVMPDGNLLISDILNRRYSFLTPDGKSIKDVFYASFNLRRLKFDSRGFLYASNMIRGEKQRWELVKFDQNMNPVATISSFETERKPRGIITHFQDTCYFDLTSKDELVWMISSKYEMNVVNSEGKLVKRIIKDYDPKKITDTDKERIEKEESSGWPMKITVELPKNYLPVEDLLIDDEDRIYVRTCDRDSKGGVFYDIFDSEGRYISRFSLPEQERTVVVKKNKIYCIISESEEGVPLAKRYAMEWK